MLFPAPHPPNAYRRLHESKDDDDTVAGCRFPVMNATHPSSACRVKDSPVVGAEPLCGTRPRTSPAAWEERDTFLLPSTSSRRPFPKRGEKEEEEEEKGMNNKGTPDVDRSVRPAPMAPHCCAEVCGKMRGNCDHPCPLRCHPGPCPPCVVSPIYHHLTCACGKTSTAFTAIPYHCYMADFLHYFNRENQAAASPTAASSSGEAGPHSNPLPLPCGTPPPVCRHRCEVPRSCGHPIDYSKPHNCHFGPCPPCRFCNAVKRLKRRRRVLQARRRDIKSMRRGEIKELCSYKDPPPSLQWFMHYLLTELLGHTTSTWKDTVAYLRQHDLVARILGLRVMEKTMSETLTSSIERLIIQFFCSDMKTISRPAVLLGRWVSAAINVISSNQSLQRMLELNEKRRKEEEEGQVKRGENVEEETKEKEGDPDDSDIDDASSVHAELSADGQDKEDDDDNGNGSDNHGEEGEEEMDRNRASL